MKIHLFIALLSLCLLAACSQEVRPYFAPGNFTAPMAVNSQYVRKSYEGAYHLSIYQTTKLFDKYYLTFYDSKPARPDDPPIDHFVIEFLDDFRFIYYKSAPKDGVSINRLNKKSFNIGTYTVNVIRSSEDTLIHLYLNKPWIPANKPQIDNTIVLRKTGEGKLRLHQVIYQEKPLNDPGNLADLLTGGENELNQTLDANKLLFQPEWCYLPGTSLTKRIMDKPFDRVRYHFQDKKRKYLLGDSLVYTESYHLRDSVVTW